MKKDPSGEQHAAVVHERRTIASRLAKVTADRLLDALHDCPKKESAPVKMKNTPCPSCSRPQILPENVAPLPCECEKDAGDEYPGRPRHDALANVLDQERAENGIVELAFFANEGDRLQLNRFLVDEKGRLYRFRDDAYGRGEWASHREKLVAELTKLKDENREVLAENARLRRASEKRRG